ncbi:MAG: hypothetical protein ACKVI8_00355 [Paraglaciecola sp.]
MSRLIIFLPILYLLQACETTNPPAENIDLAYSNSEKIRIASIPQSRRLVYVHKIDNSTERHTITLQKPVQVDGNGVITYDGVDHTFLNSEFITCAEPSSDIIESVSSKGGGELNVDLTSSLNSLASATSTLANTTANVANAAIKVGEDSRSSNTNSTFDRNASSTSNGSTQSSDGQKTGINVNYEATRAGVESAARTQIVLLASQMLFRNCEALANGAISYNDFGTYHELVIKTIETMLKASTLQAKANSDQAEANKLKAEAELAKEKAIETAKTDAGITIITTRKKWCLAQHTADVAAATGDTAKVEKAFKDFSECMEKIG